MKKVVFYCSGRNETAPLEIDGVHFYPDRASMWKELAGNHPDVSFSVYLPKTGEFIADMGGKNTHASKRISYTFLSGNESVEEIAERIAAECPDAAVAFSIPILPYDWSSLRDAMVGEELRKRGIKTVAPSVKFALDSFEKNRLSDFLRRNGFHVAQNVLVSKCSLSCTGINLITSLATAEVIKYNERNLERQIQNEKRQNSKNHEFAKSRNNIDL